MKFSFPLFFSVIQFTLFESSFASLNDSLQFPNVSLQTVTVSAFKENPVNKTSLNIQVLTMDSTSRFGNFNLTDMLSKSVGVSMLSTGVAIAKPVIRGLYGNRILVLLSGLKFDNQQWQEEHGLGLSDLGLSKVELIKGPMSVLYGSEAMGGVINLIEEVKPEIHTEEKDISFKLNSNTLGGLIQAGYKKNNGNNWLRVRVGLENNCDYSDGKNTRVLNSRFDGYYVKTSFGKVKNKRITDNNFSSSFNRFGFIFNDIYSFIDNTERRYSRSLIENPTHLVLLNIFSSENKWYLDNRTIVTLNYGVQSNKRMENEGGGAISLDMHLVTLQYLLKLQKQVSEKHKLVFANMNSVENNTNFGARKIVPDANMQETNFGAYDEFQIGKNLIIENGIGAGEKYIKTLLTPSVNSSEKDIKPFNKYSKYFNAYSGFTISAKKYFNLKANISTGVRIPNLAELSSNGLHEGVFTYEIGSPTLKNEQNFAGNFLLNFTNKIFDFYVSPFYNYFLNYVYLAPTAQEWYGFPVFKYLQQNAKQYGTEASVSVRICKLLKFSTSYSGMISKTEDKSYTPFIPAQKISNYFYITNQNKRYLPNQFFVNSDYFFAQNNIYKNEVPTPEYVLFNAGFSWSLTRKNYLIDFGICANNLTNKAYYDHLSRFKYFGLLNIGRNIVFTFKIKFKQATKQK